VTPELKLLHIETTKEPMMLWNERTDAEWCEIMHRIKEGHRPWSGSGKHDALDLAYYEGVWLRDLLHVTPTENDTVLDLGCGNGRFAATCLPYGCQYIGMDPIPGCIDFCRDAFEPWSEHFRFEQINVYNRQYFPQGTVQPIDFRIPLDDESVTYAAAVSLFTHLCTPDVAQHYIGEMVRVVKPGGTIWTTWFKSPPNEPTSITERTVFEEDMIRQWLADCAGLEWLYSHRGETTGQHDQWWVWCRKP